MMGRQERSRAIGWYASPHIICVCVAVLLALASVESMTMEVDHGEQQCVIVNLSKATTINANYEILGFPVDTMVILRHKDDGKLLYRQEGVAEDYINVEATEIGDYELCFINEKMELIQSLRKKTVSNDVRMVGLDALRKEKKDKLKAEQKDMKKPSDDDALRYSNKDDDEWKGDDDMYNMLGGFGSEDDGSWYPKDSTSKTFGFGLRLGEGAEDIQAMSEVSIQDRNMASFLKEEADVLVRYLSFFNDHESYMRGREEYHRENVKQTSTRLMWCTFIEAAVLIWVSWSQLSYIRRFFETKRVL